MTWVESARPGGARWKVVVPLLAVVAAGGLWWTQRERGPEAAVLREFRSSLPRGLHEGAQWYQAVAGVGHLAGDKAAALDRILLGKSLEPVAARCLPVMQRELTARARAVLEGVAEPTAAVAALHAYRGLPEGVAAETAAAATRALSVIVERGDEAALLSGLGCAPSPEDSDPGPRVAAALYRAWETWLKPLRGQPEYGAVREAADRRLNRRGDAATTLLTAALLICSAGDDWNERTVADLNARIEELESLDGPAAFRAAEGSLGARIDVLRLLVGARDARLEGAANSRLLRKLYIPLALRAAGRNVPPDRAAIARLRRIAVLDRRPSNLGWMPPLREAAGGRAPRWSGAVLDSRPKRFWAYVGAAWRNPEAVLVLNEQWRPAGTHPYIEQNSGRSVRVTLIRTVLHVSLVTRDGTVLWARGFQYQPRAQELITQNFQLDSVGGKKAEFYGEVERIHASINRAARSAGLGTLFR
jgi:hypothetical protein